MSTEPEFILPEPEPDIAQVYVPDVRPSAPQKRARTIPNFGHLALFLGVTGLAVLITQLFAVGIAQGLHLFPHESIPDMARDPRLILPTMFLSYFVAGILSILIFTALWRLPFAEGIRWDLAPITHRGWILVVTGVGVSIVVQLLSNFLPMPKELPIDDFFKTTLDVWLIAFFGVFIAPVFEELAFRGFLLPALANTWDFISERYHNRQKSHLHATHFEHDGEALPGTLRVTEDELETSPLGAFVPVRDPKWSVGAIVFASIVTSICFALLHADQLAHAWSPLAVLFCVSLILCAVRIRWRSLAASALVHACYNGTIFAMLFIATGGFRHLDRLKQ
jgi:membrane protease YdiL (CAAX protease family)